MGVLIGIISELNADIFVNLDDFGIAAHIHVRTDKWSSWRHRARLDPTHSEKFDNVDSFVSSESETRAVCESAKTVRTMLLQCFA